MTAEVIMWNRKSNPMACINTTYWLVWDNTPMEDGLVSWLVKKSWLEHTNFLWVNISIFKGNLSAAIFSCQPHRSHILPACLTGVLSHLHWHQLQMHSRQGIILCECGQVRSLKVQFSKTQVLCHIAKNSSKEAVWYIGQEWAPATPP